MRKRLVLLLLSSLLVNPYVFADNGTFHGHAEYDDQFFGFVLVAMLCSLADLFVIDRANAYLSKIQLFQ